MNWLSSTCGLRRWTKFQEDQHGICSHYRPCTGGCGDTFRRLLKYESQVLETNCLKPKIGADNSAGLLANSAVSTLAMASTLSIAEPSSVGTLSGFSSPASGH